MYLFLLFFFLCLYNSQFFNKWNFDLQKKLSRTLSLCYFDIINLLSVWFLKIWEAETFWIHVFCFWTHVIPIICIMDNSFFGFSVDCCRKWHTSNSYFWYIGIKDCAKTTTWNYWHVLLSWLTVTHDIFCIQLCFAFVTYYW